MPEIKMKLMSKVEYEDLNKAINDGTQECFECAMGNVELVGGHDYDYGTKVGVRFYVDLHCRDCNSNIRVREQIIDRSDDYGTPDSGGIGAHCNRCCWGFWQQLY